MIIRVILLEDDDDLRSLLTEILDDKGYEVFSYTNPFICPLQKIPACRCKDNERCTDFIITDIEMPNMNGFEFIENLREKKCKCNEVIVMSASLNPEYQVKAEELNCKFFSKPLPLQEFNEFIDERSKSFDPNRKLKDWFKEK